MIEICYFYIQDPYVKIIIVILLDLSNKANQ